MTISSAQNDYTALFVQRQELFMHDCLRKLFDTEVKLVTINKINNELKEKFEESQKQVEIQNGMMTQAAASIENLTIKNKNILSENERLNARLREAEARINELRTTENNLRAEVTLNTSRITGLEKELIHQREELQSIYNEQKKKLPKKKVNTKIEVIEDNTF